MKTYAHKILIVPSRKQNLQLGDHILFGVVRNAFVSEQATSEMLLVVSFKHIFFLKEAEQDHRLIEHHFNFLFRKLR